MRVKVRFGGLGDSFGSGGRFQTCMLVDGPGIRFAIDFGANPDFGIHPERDHPKLTCQVEPEEFLGPRHFCFHPSLDILYFSNEQDCSVTGYRLDTAT